MSVVSSSLYNFRRLAKPLRHESASTDTYALNILHDLNSNTTSNGSIECRVRLIQYNLELLW